MQENFSCTPPRSICPPPGGGDDPGSCFLWPISCAYLPVTAARREIDRVELESALKDMDLFTTQESFETIFQQLDKDNSGLLDFDEFKSLARVSEAFMRIIESIPLEEVEAVEADERSAESGEDEAQVQILTKEDGKNRGRAYIYNMPSSEGVVWIDKLKQAVKEVLYLGAVMVYDSDSFRNWLGVTCTCPEPTHPRLQ